MMKRFFVGTLVTTSLVLSVLGFTPYAQAQVPLVLSAETRSFLIQLIALLQSLQSSPSFATFNVSTSTKTTNPPVLSSPEVEFSGQSELKLKVGGGSCSPPEENTKPFGGDSSGRFFDCNCSDGYLIKVGSPRGGTFHINNSSRICEYGRAESSGVVLGNYYPGTGNRCRYVSGNHCNVMPNDGIVQMIGTSR